MPFIPVKRDRTSKPPVGTPLRSDGHWSVQGLASCLVFTEGDASVVELVSRRQVQAYSYPAGTTYDNKGFHAGGAYSCAFDLGDPGGTGDMTFIGSVRFDADSSWPPQSFMSKTSAWEIRRRLLVGGEYPSNKIEMQVRHDTTPAYAASLYAVPLGKDTVVAGTYTASLNRCAVYCAGANVTNSSTDGVGNLDAAVGAPIVVAGVKSETEYYTECFSQGYIQWASYYTRALSSDEIRSLSINPWQIFEPETVWISTGVAATLDQYSFRFFADDGSESASSAKADINTNVTLSVNEIARLRFLIDATGDPVGKQFQLEYRRKPSGGSFGDWTKVS